jgi:hypothetical protein
MFTGIIKTRDVLSHPILIIRMKGLRGFIDTLGKALSHKHYRFVDCIEITTKKFIRPVRRKPFAR